jgi:hypothetical protein
MARSRSNKKRFEIEWIYSYHEGWTVPIRVWVKLPYLPGFFIELQIGLLLIILEGIAFVVDWLGFGFRPLTQYGVIPLGLAWGLNKIKPEGKNLYQWFFSFLRLLYTAKETNGALEPYDVRPTKLRILSRYYPDEKLKKSKRRWKAAAF